MFKISAFAVLLLLIPALCKVTMSSGEPSTISPLINGTGVDDGGGGENQGPGFLTGFISSLEVTILSELGDNSFFISLVLAMRHSRIVVFIGAMSAFFFMTIFTALFGLVSTLIPRMYTYYLSIVIFTCFGVKMLHDGFTMKKTRDVDEQIQQVDDDMKAEDEDEDEEASVPMTEVAAAGVEKNKTSDSEDSGCCTPLDGDPITAPPPTSGDDGSTTTSALQSVQEEELDKGAVTLPKKKDPTKKKKRSGLRKFWRSKRCHVYLQALTMTFLAEWGDRSQLAVIVIAATENIWGTCVGCLLGHAICCSIAVVGGRLIAKKISVKTVTIIGGIMFLGFAIISLIFLKPST
ncbi:GDT1-like protein sll0615 [Folsomia candida]|nr:GDT1-like protein sll0615 [Folsomia candida]XP_021963941.1 GDT1-like protein sll0615 [Folsomia candida]